MKKYIFTYLTILAFISGNHICLQGQSTFNILPELDGQITRGTCRAIIADSNSIKIIGTRVDPNLYKPFLARINYQGELLSASPLFDSLFSLASDIDLAFFRQKKEDRYYIYARRNFMPVLLEWNTISGEILRSKQIPNPIYPDEINGQGSFYYDAENTITLLSFIDFYDTVMTYITLLDTLFNVTDFIEVDHIAQSHYPYAIKRNPDGTFSIIGDAIYKNDEGDEYIENYFLKVDSTGHTMEYRNPPTPLRFSFLYGYVRTVLEDSNGNWIIAAHVQGDPSDSCYQCYDYFVYIYSVTADFDSLLWATRFYDIPYPNATDYRVLSLTIMNDGYVASGAFFGNEAGVSSSSGVLFKTSITGDSVWIRHYIPLGWGNERVQYANLVDVKATPFGTIVATGEVKDKDLGIVRPWIIQMDSLGCLVPGCDIVSTAEENTKNTHADYFIIYPNPVSEELYLLSTITSNDPVNIRVVSNDGIVVKTKDFAPQSGYQYVLPIGDLQPGAYHLVLTNRKMNQIESHTFIRQ